MLIARQMILEEFDRMGHVPAIPSRCVALALERFESEVRTDRGE
jgi:hypothetical protein